MPLTDEPLALAADVGRELLARRWRIATAESCTGGLVGAAITAIAGSSEWFERGFITYSNDAKRQMLGVPAVLIEAHGAVSEAVAAAMAAGALRHSRAQCAVSVTGVAGPGGGSPAKPVGMVCLGWAADGAAGRVVTRRFVGDRAGVRAAAVVAALRGVLEMLGDVPQPSGPGAPDE